MFGIRGVPRAQPSPWMVTMSKYDWWLKFPKVWIIATHRSKHGDCQGNQWLLTGKHWSIMTIISLKHQFKVVNPVAPQLG